MKPNSTSLNLGCFLVTSMSFIECNRHNIQELPSPGNKSSDFCLDFWDIVWICLPWTSVGNLTILILPCGEGMCMCSLMDSANWDQPSSLSCHGARHVSESFRLAHLPAEYYQMRFLKSLVWCIFFKHTHIYTHIYTCTHTHIYIKLPGT